MNSWSIRPELNSESSAPFLRARQKSYIVGYKSRAHTKLLNGTRCYLDSMISGSIHLSVFFSLQKACTKAPDTVIPWLLSRDPTTNTYLCKEMDTSMEGHNFESTPFPNLSVNWESDQKASRKIGFWWFSIVLRHGKKGEKARRNLSEQ